MRYSKILYEVLEELVKTCGIMKCFCFIKNALFLLLFLEMGNPSIKENK